MGRYIRLSLALFIGILLSFNECFADMKGLKYSTLPTCNEKDHQVVCGQGEVAVCPNDTERNIKYIPLCNDGQPECVLENSDGNFGNFVSVPPECVEPAQCEGGIARCSKDKVAKCPDNNNECNCLEQICDYNDTWEISNVGSNLH